jgi:hypothetical protein
MSKREAYIGCSGTLSMFMFMTLYNYDRLEDWMHVKTRLFRFLIVTFLGINSDRPIGNTFPLAHFGRSSEWGSFKLCRTRT